MMIHVCYMMIMSPNQYQSSGVSIGRQIRAYIHFLAGQVYIGYSIGIMVIHHSETWFTGSYVILHVF
jgi:hypothetical protein